MSQDFAAVGKRIAQRDTPLKAIGAAKYTVDMKLLGMLIGKVLRSPYPHANIKRIDKSKAEKFPGVEAVITLEDTPKIQYASSFRDLPIATSGLLQRADEYILNDKARYVGDAIAAVAAVDERVAEEALRLIEVEYEELPFATNPGDAIKPSVPKIHDYAENNIAVKVSYPLAKGDVEKGFQESDVVVEETFSVTKQIAGHMETQATIVSVDPTGKVTCYTGCQMAFALRRSLARIFSLPEGMINVVTPFVGGSFGARLSIYNETAAIVLAMKTRKPVKMEYSMEETFTCLQTRTGDEYTVKTGFKKDGTLHAMQIKVQTWAGAYLGRAQLAGAITLMWGMGHYRCPNTAGECEVVYCNSTPSGSQRGYGNSEIMWGVEQVVDMAAEKLGMDPIELRLKNTKKAGEPSNMVMPIESTYLEDCIRVGVDRIGWREKWGRKKEGLKRRGVGVGTMTHCSGAYPVLMEHSGAMVNFNGDGSASLIINPGSPGTHIWGALAQIAAEELGIYPEDFYIVTGETDKTLFDLGSFASRTTYVTGTAVMLAAREAKEQLLERAARLLDVSPGELEVKDRRVYVKSTPEKGLPVSEVVRSTMWDVKGDSMNIAGKSSFASKAVSPPTAAYFTEVEVDTETGEVKVLKFISVQDCGTAINPMTVEGQCEGGVQQGIGYALTEDFSINKGTGVLESDNFHTYKMLSSLDMPETEIIIINKPDPKGPFGAKGVGEPGSVGVAPAIANAIYDAVGVRITDLPITPEKVLKALKEKKS
ncbi:xanthine dehydrogenase family protein molybdopterin-binding subunit [Chloroflexota bacterium]